MSHFPSIEKIILEVHQSFGLSDFKKKQKDKFLSLGRPLDKQRAQFAQIYRSITEVLKIKSDIQTIKFIEDLTHFLTFQKSLELKTWTFKANHRFILWYLITHSYAPGLGRIMAINSIEDKISLGMPAGKFWYLPNESERGTELIMPVTQVMDWLLDLMGIPLDRVRELDFGEVDPEPFIRDLFNWKRGVIPRISTLDKYFSEKITLPFKGCFEDDEALSLEERFAKAIAFINEKKLSINQLIEEIGEYDFDHLNRIINGEFQSSIPDEDKSQLITLIKIRYSKPSTSIIRKRFFIARAMQDGYKRLLEYLCPNVELKNANIKENKLLQAINIYKFVYRNTIHAEKMVRLNKARDEDIEFKSHLHEYDKFGMYASITKVPGQSGDDLLGGILSNIFLKNPDNKNLPDMIGCDLEHLMHISKRKEKECKGVKLHYSNIKELEKLNHSIEKRRFVEKTNDTWLLIKLINCYEPSVRLVDCAVKRLLEISKGGIEQALAKYMELFALMEIYPRNPDTPFHINRLFKEIKSHTDYEVLSGPVLALEAKHLLNQNRIKKAEKLFEESLSKLRLGAFGDLRGVVARDLFATKIQTQKFHSNNFEKYYREMLSYDVIEGESFKAVYIPALIFKDPFRDELEKSKLNVLNQLESLFNRKLYRPYFKLT